jgi:molybdenum cofactor cytidylyltransferase
MISAILLAAGESNRMGQPKQLMPFGQSTILEGTVEAFIANKRGIIIPVYQGRRGNPVIFAIKYKGELLNLKGDIGGREIIKRHPDDVLEVAVNCEGVLIDIDTMENYTSMLRQQ